MTGPKGSSTTCPSCKRIAHKADNPKFPFCSERCQLVDLGRWFGEEYRVPGDPADDQGTPGVPESEEP